MTTYSLQAQYFRELASTPFDGVIQSSVAFEDVDADGDLDLLITGRNNDEEGISKLYLNDGEGNFSVQQNTTLEGVQFSATAFSDVDGDGDKDLLLTGHGTEPIAKLYLNDGTGVFTEKSNTPFDGVGSSAVSFGDVDRDGDEDLLLTGSTKNERIAKLYKNEGMGTFVEVKGTPFTGVASSATAFADVDGDNDLDVLITGRDANLQSSTKLFLNDGNGGFSEKTGTAITNLHYSTVVFSDVNGDDAPDLIISGTSSSNGMNQPISEIYLNDAAGNFTLLSGLPFEGHFYGSVACSDIDGDGDQDLIVTGGINESHAKLYLNNGNAIFSEAQNEALTGVWYSSIAFADVDGDEAQDVLITGSVDFNGKQLTAKLYRNVGLVNSVGSTASDLSIDYSLFPNPTAAEFVNVRFVSLSPEEVSLQVYNSEGILVRRQATRTTTGTQTIKLDVSHLARGIYFVELLVQGQSRTAELIIR
ncbi:FG-GAP-like repeat-containing protein [Lewinella sp. 4G2]|uniref:FG-GAP-like repeat-containing protein n=1 Tax=Lewinella sp. 4G2 TaxID=1803372 RepID=UPI0018D28403|nr:FG-GAP-like repeat-containing protein [Lewinella sp. 4G2]